MQLTIDLKGHTPKAIAGQLRGLADIFEQGKNVLIGEETRVTTTNIINKVNIPRHLIDPDQPKKGPRLRRTKAEIAAGVPAGTLSKKAKPEEPEEEETCEEELTDEETPEQEETEETESEEESEEISEEAETPEDTEEAEEGDDFLDDMISGKTVAPLKPVKKGPTVAHTHQDVINAFKAYADKNGFEKAKKIIQRFGVKSVKELTPDQYSLAIKTVTA